MQSSDPTIIAEIARYVEQTRRRPLTPAVRDAAIRCLLDLLGSAAAGKDDRGVAAVQAAGRSTMAPGPFPVWFSGASSSLIGAAWANGAAASALDLDDGHRRARGHPGAAVIPAALAVAQQTGAGLEELLVAVALGYEVGVTIASARRTYGTTGTWAPFAVVCAAAALRGTPAKTIAHALSIAGENGPSQSLLSASSAEASPEGSDVKEGIPWAVLTGLMALELAERGHTGPRDLLNSDLHYGFPTPLDLGAAEHILSVYFKLYACCRHVHAPLDALLGVLDENQTEIASIRHINVRTNSGALRILNKIHPVNLVEVQYSIPYCLALAAIDGPRSLLPLTSNALDRFDISSLAARVTLTLDPEVERCFPDQTLAQVEISGEAGDFSSARIGPRGDASAPLSWEELKEKLRAVTRFTISPEKTESIVKTVSDARDGGGLPPIMACLADG